MLRVILFFLITFKSHSDTRLIRRENRSNVSQRIKLLIMRLYKAKITLLTFRA